MKNILSALLLAGSIAVSAQAKEDSIQFAKISTEILNKGKAYTELRDLTKNIGHRLSGSESYEKAVQWAA